MASEPYFDRGRWRMKWWSGPERGWLVATLCPHPGSWSKSSPPKRAPAEAKLIAQKYRDMEIQARHGVDVAPVRGHDLAEHLAGYRERFGQSRSKSSLPTLDRSIRLFVEHCAAHKVKTLESVGPQCCRLYLSWRATTVGHATMRTERGLLSHVWTEAKLDGLVSDNPWAMCRVPGQKRTEPPPYWTRDELAKLANTAKGWVRDFVLLGANTGIRASALLGLEWRDVNFELNVIRVRQSLDKAKKGYQLPLTATANAVLARRLATDKANNPHVFFGPKTGRPPRLQATYDRMKRLVLKAGLPDHGHYLHILRHTFATHAVASGVPLHTVSAWLGHSSVKMTEVYAHVIPMESQRQIERFDLGT